MYSINLKSLPVLQYAHEYSSHSYITQLRTRQQFIELTYLEEGNLTLSDEQETIVMKEDTLMAYLYPNKKNLFTDKYQKHLTIGFSIDFEYSDKEPRIFLPSNEIIAMPNVKPLFTKIIEEYNMNLQVEKDYSFHSYTSMKINSLIFDLLNEINSICKKTVEKNERNFGYDRYAKKAKIYILNNITKQVKVSAIAAELGISPGFLSRVFKSATNQTLIEYTNYAKLYKIKELNETKGITIKEAAYQLGFSDPNYVSRLYKKYFGKNITD